MRGRTSRTLPGWGGATPSYLRQHAWSTRQLRRPSRQQLRSLPQVADQGTSGWGRARLGASEAAGSRAGMQRVRQSVGRLLGQTSRRGPQLRRVRRERASHVTQKVRGRAREPSRRGACCAAGSPTARHGRRRTAAEVKRPPTRQLRRCGTVCAEGSDLRAGTCCRNTCATPNVGVRQRGRRRFERTPSIDQTQLRRLRHRLRPQNTDVNGLHRMRAVGVSSASDRLTATATASLQRPCET